MKLLYFVVLFAIYATSNAIELQSTLRPNHHRHILPRNRHLAQAAARQLGLADCGPLCELDLPGIIAYQGYPVETHPIQSIDGMLTLNLYRIPCGRNFSACAGVRRPPVLLQHGLLDSGTTWILNPVNEALGFILADAGYDVWIGNNRGTTYSPCNTNECWAFSYDEMGKFDLPTFVNYITNATGFPKISYVGHSEGTTQAFAGFSINADLASRINLFVALAPAVWVNNQRSPLVTVLADLDAVVLFELFGVKDFLPSSGFLKFIAGLFCNGGLFTPLCEDIIFALCGVDPAKAHDFNSSRAEVYLTHTPAGTSVQNMAHWTQAVKNSNFQMYDYGKKGNRQHYNQDTPPVYDLTKFTVPTAFFSGGQDYLADPTDVEQLMNILPKNTVVFNHYSENYSHLDFVWGMDAYTEIYPSVLQLLKQYNNL